MKIERETKSPFEMAKQSSVHNGIYVHLFMQDIRIYLIHPSPGGLEDNRLQVQPYTDRRVQQVLMLFSEPMRLSRNIGELRPRDLSGVLAAFIGRVGCDLALSGESFWEIGKRRVGDSGPDSLSTLLWITGEVTDKGNRIRQRYRREIDGRRSSCEVNLPASQACVFRLPQKLGTARDQRTRISTLQEVSKIVPPFVEEGWSRLKHEPAFRQKDYSRTQFRELGKAMKDWGWIGRSWTPEHVTEYYHFYRQAKFHKALAVLRDSIISDMNAVLKRLDVNCEIKLRDTFSVDQIDDVISQLEDGSISFGDAMDRVRS